MHGFQLTEHDRQISNIAMVGTIYALDEARARVRVAIGGLRSAWLPWVTLRAGPDRAWWAPEVGEQVVVLSPNGDLTQGIVLGAIYRDLHPAPGTSKDKHITVYKDGTTIEYDRAAGRYEIDCVGDVVIKGARTLLIQFQGDITVHTDGNATVNVAGTTQVTSGGATTVQAPSVTVDSPTTTLTGDLQVDGSIHSNGDTVAGSISLQHHVHSGVRSGSSDTSTPH